MDEQKLIALEEKIAWLEAILDDNGKELTRQAEIIAKLEAQIKFLYSKQTAPDAVRDLKDEGPPPHY